MWLIRMSRSGEILAENIEDAANAAALLKELRAAGYPFAVIEGDGA
jgi:hypothetical protein